MWFWPTQKEQKEPKELTKKQKGYKLVERTNEGKYILVEPDTSKSYSVSLNGEMFNLGRYQKFVSTLKLRKQNNPDYQEDEGDEIVVFKTLHGNRINEFFFENGKIVFNMRENTYMFYNKGQTYHEQCDGYVYENTVGGKRRKTRRRHK